MSSVWKFENWIAASWERLSPGRHILLGIDQWIFREHSPHQEVIIARVPELGRGLFLDGVVQFLEADEFIYHEHLALPPLLFHRAPRRVLIQGGGDGLALREVLRDPRVEEVVVVDIDGLVVEACRKHLGDLQCGSYDDPRARVRIQDIRTYLSGSPGSFDVVVVDLIDAYDSDSLSLYEGVLPLTRGVLAPGGVVGLFGELARPSYRISPLHIRLARSFRNVVMHRAFIESFGSEYGFLLGSDQVVFKDVATQTLCERAGVLRGPLRSLVPQQFPAAFLLPPHLERRIRESLADSPSEDHSPESPFSWVFPETTGREEDPD